MLHKLEIPAYRPQLEAILDFQHQLLFFACIAPSLPLNTGIFKAAFGSQRGDWLSERCWQGSRDTLFYKELAKLIDYVAQNPLEGPAIVDAFSKDRNFYDHLQDPNFEFQYPKLSPGAKAAVKTLMIYFYEKLLEIGFPDSVHLCGTEAFTRKLLLKGFYNANPSLKVCPGCDGPSPDLSNNTRGREDEEEDKSQDDAEVDHFFPKAFYPFFSIHFMNLVPLCTICNTKAKKDKDPLNKYAGVGMLQRTFMPFVKPAIPCIEVSIYKNSKNIPKVVIKDRQQGPSPRVENLDRTFRLSPRWENHLERWIWGMTLRIRESGPRGKRNRQEIEREIRRWLRQFAKAPEDNIGQMDHLLVQRGYASYALGDPLELELLIEQVMDDNAPKTGGFRR